MSYDLMKQTRFKVIEHMLKALSLGDICEIKTEAMTSPKSALYGFFMGFKAYSIDDDAYKQVKRYKSISKQMLDNDYVFALFLMFNGDIQPFLYDDILSIKRLNA